jgi:hypothetical protein
MTDPFETKEQKVRRLFRVVAPVDTFIKSYEYMNCIKISERQSTDLALEYEVASTDNDGFNLGDIISWSEVDQYITKTVLESGIEEDIECLYCFLLSESLL